MFTVQRFNIHIRIKFTYLPQNGTECQPNNLIANLIFFAVPRYSWCHIWRSCRGVVNWPIWSQGDNTTLRSPLWAWMASYRLGKESSHVVRWSHYHRLGARSDLTCCSGKILIYTKRVISYFRYIKILTTPKLSGHLFCTWFGFLQVCAQVSSGNCETMESWTICNFVPKASESW